MDSNYSDLIRDTIYDHLMICYMEPGFPFEHIGKTMLDLFGYMSEKEFAHALDGKIINFIHPEDRQFVIERVNQQLITSKEYTVEYRICKKDGSYIWIQDRGQHIEALDGKGIILYTYEVLSKQDVNNVLDESKLYGEIVYRSTHGIYVVEQESYRLLYTNNAMDQILASMEIKDYLGKKCYCAFRQCNQPCEECFVSMTSHTGESQEVYLEFLSAYYSVVSHSIEWRGIPAYVIYLSDISEDKKTRLELAETKKKLTAAIAHAGLAYWEYDLVENTAFLNAIAIKEYALEEVIENYPVKLYELGTIHPDSIPLYNSLIQAVKHGTPTARAEIKTIDGRGNLLWK
ncbi:MAG: PAS domain-containing protein, partial [Lachnospiraceae bacterium]